MRPLTDTSPVRPGTPAGDPPPGTPTGTRIPGIPPGTPGRPISTDIGGIPSTPIGSQNRLFVGDVPFLVGIDFAIPSATWPRVRDALLRRGDCTIYRVFSMNGKQFQTAVASVKVTATLYEARKCLVLCGCKSTEKNSQALQYKHNPAEFSKVSRAAVMVTVTVVVTITVAVIAIVMVITTVWYLKVIAMVPAFEPPLALLDGALDRIGPLRTSLGVAWRSP